MKIVNFKINELVDKLYKDRIVIFGIGEYYKGYVMEQFPKELVNNVVYAIDNNVSCSEIFIGDKQIPVYHPSRIKSEKSCTILLMSTNEMYDMYQQLENMDLNDDIRCGSIPLAFAEFVGDMSTEIHKKIFNNCKKIDKKIHSFWFSGDKKPEDYQKCIDSWYKMCPDYEIIEWNMDNYDYNKNAFMKQAIEKRKWAFASDYARLDVVYQFGGVYMDMDVELLKPLDSLLGNKAFFTFDVNRDIDLGTFGSVSGNDLLAELMHQYDNIDFSGDMKSMNYYCQPRYIRSVLKKNGVLLNGNAQYVDEMAFLPRNYLAPKDSILYEMIGLTEETIGIHHYNAGWKNDDYRNRRIVKNGRLARIFRECSK